jgi:PAS domain S-box-containing protein
MKGYTYEEAKGIIQKLCEEAAGGKFATQDSFLETLRRQPEVAAQGYNAFGKIFFWNNASAHLYGYSEHEAINKDLVEMILPPDLQQFARDMIANGQKTGRMPDAGPCDLLDSSGEYVTVYSGHLVFQWDDSTTPEFYCIDLPLNTDSPGIV